MKYTSAHTRAGFERMRRGNARLEDHEVIRILERLKHGHSPRAIARDYGVGMETIRKIGRGDTYAWVTPPAPEITSQERQEIESAIDPEMQIRAQASLAKLQAQLAAEQQRVDSNPYTGRGGEAPVRYIAPPPAVETPEAAILQMQRTFDNDQALMRGLSSSKRIPFPELQQRYAACRGDRTAISSLFNEIARSQPRDILDSLLGDLK